MVLVLASLGGAGCASSDEVSSDRGPEPAGGSTTTETPKENASSEPATAPSLVISGTVTVPEGERGKLSIVLMGTMAAGDQLLPVVVRNRTAQPVSFLEVTGTARSSSGDLVASGSLARDFTPAVVGPGEWAFSTVFFEGNVPSDASFDLIATGDTGDGRIFADVTIAEHNVVPGDSGPTVVGIVVNETDEAVDAVRVELMCFDDAGKEPFLQVGTYADGGPIPRDGTASFSVGLPSDASCQNFAMGPTG